MPERTVPAAAAARIGIDLGGTKISAIAMTTDGRVLFHDRRPTPRHDYKGVIRTITELVKAAEQTTGSKHPLPVGIGMPGSISPVTGRVQNANSTWLNGRPFARDLKTALARPVRLANDANCLALSEAADGAAAGARTVFGVILGTGCGGGLVHAGRIIAGRNRIGGEWGHNPLPWPRADEWPGPECWCGRRGCLETWISGSGLQRDFAETTGRTLTGEEIVAAAAKGDTQAHAALDRHADRLARGLAHVINIFDPDMIVIGGGLSQLPGLVESLPERISPHVFADAPQVTIRRAVHGPDSGVRGAARLWDMDDADWIF